MYEIETKFSFLEASLVPRKSCVVRMEEETRVSGGEREERGKEKEETRRKERERERWTPELIARYTQLA